MQTYILTIFFIFFGFCSFAQNEKKNPSLEDLYAMPANQYAVFQYSDEKYDTFFCDPSQFDTMSINFFIHCLKRDNPAILEVKSNAQTHILKVTTVAKVFSEKSLHLAVLKARDEVAEILKNSPAPYTEFENIIAKQSKRKDGK
jgi:hypothetical protein